MNPSHGGLVVSALTVAGDDEGGWNLGEMPLGLCSGRDQHHMVLSSIQGLLGRVRLPAPDSERDILCLIEYGWPDSHMLMELSRVLTDKQTQGTSKMA